MGILNTRGVDAARAELDSINQRLRAKINASIIPVRSIWESSLFTIFVPTKDFSNAGLDRLRIGRRLRDD
jgi:hypothetical protein